MQGNPSQEPDVESAGSRFAGSGDGPAYEYTTFPRRFVSYRWFKPLLVLGLGFAIMLGLQILLLFITIGWAGDVGFIFRLASGYEDMDVFTGPGALAELGGVATILPSLALAALIVGDRPFSSYSSSRGGWNWGAFGKCLLVALGIFVVEAIVEIVFFSDGGAPDPVRFDVIGFVTCSILVPFQCIAEEYLFRGLALQMIGSWTKLPVLAILISAVAFALGHPYNMLGMVSIFINGVVWGVIAWQTKGLEATSALHVVNNMLAFYFAGFGLSSLSSEVDGVSFAIAIVIDLVFAAAVLLADRKFGWFSSQGDGTVEFNERKRQKAAFKQYLKAMKQASR